jgi:putative transposase
MTIGRLPGGKVIATSLHLLVVPSVRPVPVLFPERLLGAVETVGVDAPGRALGHRGYEVPRCPGELALLVLMALLVLACLRPDRPRRAARLPTAEPPGARRSAPKPAWVRREVIRLKSLLPDEGCRKIADRFNRLHDGRGQRVGKSYVADVIRDHQREILELRRRRKKPPRRIPRNLIWAMDLTFLPTPGGPSPVVGLIDHGSRACLALVPTRTRSAIGLLRIVFDAVERFGTPKILRTDNEPAFRSWLWRFALTLLGIRAQRTRPFAPWENGRIERFFGTLKRTWRSATDRGYQLDDLGLEMARFRAWYNFLRPHQHLEGRTPADSWEGTTVRVGGGRKLYQEWGGALRGFG